MLIPADDTFDDLDALFMNESGHNAPQRTTINEANFADLDSLFKPTCQGRVVGASKPRAREG